MDFAIQLKCLARQRRNDEMNEMLVIILKGALVLILFPIWLPLLIMFLLGLVVEWSLDASINEMETCLENQ